MLGKVLNLLELALLLLVNLHAPHKLGSVGSVGHYLRFEILDPLKKLGLFSTQLRILGFYGLYLLLFMDLEL